MNATDRLALSPSWSIHSTMFLRHFIFISVPTSYAPFIEDCLMHISCSKLIYPLGYSLASMSKSEAVFLAMFIQEGGLTPYNRYIILSVPPSLTITGSPRGARSTPLSPSSVSTRAASAPSTGCVARLPSPHRQVHPSWSILSVLSGTGSGDASEEVPDVDRPGSAFSPVGVVLSMCPILCPWDTLSLSDRRSSP